MRRLLTTITHMLQGISQAVSRFPLTVLCLLGSASLACYVISLHAEPDLIIQKLLLVFLLGSLAGVAAQFAWERWPNSSRRRLTVYGLAVLLIASYYFMLADAPSIDLAVMIRTLVVMFVLVCLFLWFPASGGKFDFNSVALIHFKSALTSVVYAIVLSIGLTGLITAIDVLLFRLNRDVYLYTLVIVWLLFATLYYLAQLPLFNSEKEADRRYTAEASEYPRVLEILVSRIAVPLLAAYTAVLLIYFIKIGLTRQWPVGQLGPLVLGYAAAGQIVFILASRLDNRWALSYQRLFPKALIPIVLMQLVAIYIRLQAYGITEARYYLTLFAVFSLLVGIIFSLRPRTKNSVIALLAAGLALVSILPPVDALTVSRLSQVSRLEQLLQKAGVLVAGQLQPKADVDLAVRVETTNIINYLARRDYLASVSWLPADFNVQRDMRQTLGFDPTYSYMQPSDMEYFYAHLEPQAVLPVAGFDVMLRVGNQRDELVRLDFVVGGANYQLVLEPMSDQDVRLSIQTAAGTELVSTRLQDFVDGLRADDLQNELPLERMTLDVASAQCKLRIIFQNINVNSSWMHCNLIILVGF